MKKFWVSLLSVLVLFGGCLLASCGTKKISLGLSTNSIEICLNDNTDHTGTVTVSVKGISGGTVTPHSSNTEVATVSSTFSMGQNIITVQGRSEGQADIYVVSDYKSSVQSVFTVNVYSNATKLEEQDVLTTDGKSFKFAVRNNEPAGAAEGQTALNLNDYVDKFIKTTPSKARKNIIWSLPDNFQGDATLANNILTVGSSYRENQISVVATDEYTGQTTTVVLSVLDKLDENSISMTYSQASGVQNPETSIRLVSNLSSEEDPYAQATIQVTVDSKSSDSQEKVKLEHRTTMLNGQQSALLSVSELTDQNNINGTHLFEVKAAEEINLDFRLAFELGYERFAYKVTAPKIYDVKCYEKINKIEFFSREDNKDIPVISEQNIYTSYTNSSIGAPYRVIVSPRTAPEATKAYKVRLDFSMASTGLPEEYQVGDQVLSGDIISSDTLQIFYFKNGTPTPLNFKGENNIFESTEAIDATDIYIKANNEKVKSYITGVKVSLQSIDNENVKVDGKTFNLYQSASNFEFDKTDKTVNLATNTTLTKTHTLTLYGQTTVAGLQVETKGEGFEVVSKVPEFVGSKTETIDGEIRTGVTFNINFKVTQLGYTGKGSYRIVHSNGIESEWFDVDMYLPLTSATVDYDHTSDSVLKSVYDGGILTELYVKTGTATPLILRKNALNGKDAAVTVEYGEYDNTLISIDKNSNTIQTLKDGMSKLIITIKGRDENGLPKEFLYKILIESYTMPTTMSANPRAIEVYARTSVADNEVSVTERIVRVSLGNAPVTNFTLDNFSFYSTALRRIGAFADGEVTWGDGFYKISDIFLSKTKNYITFKITGLTTGGVQVQPDQLQVIYSSGKDDKNISATIDINIVNATRVEKITLENYQPDIDVDGKNTYQLYFKTQDAANGATNMLVFSHAPSGARNKAIKYLQTRIDGQELEFLTIADTENGASVRLKPTQGMIGYIYAMPMDAVYQNRINYCFVSGKDSQGNDVIMTASIDYRDLGKAFGSGGETYFSYLCKNAFFINNQGQRVAFKDILVRIKVTVADGSNEDLAFQIYTKEELQNIDKTLWYRLMANVTFDNWTSFDEFSGGIKGDNSNITINLTGGAFVDINKGTIKDLTFTGQVNGGGFVANTNETGGVIDNVTVDVQIVGGEYAPSVVYGGAETYVGSIVGVNKGAMSNIRALGTKVNARSSYVGGVVGQMAGNATLTNAAFEIYTFKNTDKTTYNNTLTGYFVGGVVGNIGGNDYNKPEAFNGTIERVYAYDYSLTDGKCNLIAENIQNIVQSGALAGYVVTNVTFNQSFAVVNVKETAHTTMGITVTLNNSYNSYYNNGEYISDEYNRTTQSLWIESGNGFDISINGGKAYLKDFHQTSRIDDLSECKLRQKIVLSNELYKGVSDEQGALVLFKYEVTTSELNMNDSEKRALAALNTISLSEIFETEVADSLVILSENNAIVDVSGSNLIVKRTGEVDLRISSRQNFNNDKILKIKVVLALSDIRATKVAVGGNDDIEKTIEPLQRGKSLTVIYSFKQPSILLGNRGNTYELRQDNDLTFISTMTGPGVDPKVHVTNAGSTYTYSTSGLTDDLFNVTTTVDSGTFDSVATAKDRYRNILNSIFTKNFSIRLFDGAVRLELTDDQVSITPSSMGAAGVTLWTSDENDTMTPEIRFDNSLNSTAGWEIEAQGDNFWVASYLGVSRFNISRSEWKFEKDEYGNHIKDAAGNFIKSATYYFSVHESYRAEIAEDQNYIVTLRSKSQLESDSFKMVVTRQDFTNLSVSNYNIYREVYNRVNGSNAYATIYHVDESKTTGILAPGGRSIMAVNINPDYAYYDHLTIEYSSDGTTVLSPLTIDYMNKNTTGQYYISRDNSKISNYGNGLRVEPENRIASNLYFKLWVDSQVEDGAIITVTVKFYDGKQIDAIRYVNYFLTISRVGRPQVLVDGQENSILAKGQSAELKVIVPYDQEIDIKTLTTRNIKDGITIYTNNWKVDDEEIPGYKTFTTTISASIRAVLEEDASGMFSISVAVSRIVNGYETTDIATAYVNLVDFKLDIDKISLKDTEDDTFTAYLGLKQNLEFTYPTLPRDYHYGEGVENDAAMKKIEAARDSFLSNGWYADPSTRYYINYDKTKYREDAPEAGKININRRLAYYSTETGQWVDIYSENSGYNTIGNHLEWTYDENRNVMQVRGTSFANTTIRMKLRTTMDVANQPYTSDYEFNILISAYSDEDVPLLVTNETEFVNMAEGDEAQNYILMNDITLENYTPIDTTLIDSFDGNGYTIHIESFNMPEGNNLELALFKNVTSNTTLKNVRVNLYQGGQIEVDVSTAGYSNVNIAGFALTNSGVITNCEVVSYRRSGTSITVGTPGINVTYVNGKGTTPISITGTGVTSTVSGFVGSNESTGSITNSRVGGSEISLIVPTTHEATAYMNISQSLTKFNLVAQGNVAGFVNSNSGAVASSFVKRVGISNASDNSTFYTSGFVGINNGKILTSYVEGVKAERELDTQWLTGSNISSKQGIITGFVYSNSDNAVVQDSYSNISIANQSSDSAVYLASGFVYRNSGRLENCYSASQIANLRYSQMNFSGVNSVGDLQTVGGTYTNCYYYSSKTAGDGSPTEGNYNSGATQLAEVDSEKYFYGFSIADKNTEGVWKFVNGRLNLVEADKIALSHRYLAPDPEEPDNKEKYILPYSKVFTGETGNQTLNLVYGSEINPIIIRTAQEFVAVTGNSKSSFIQEYYKNNNISGNYRIVKDLDLAELLTQDEPTVELPSSKKTLTGAIYGNGFTILNIAIANENAPLAFGLFASIEGTRANEADPIQKALVINLNLTVSRVVNTDVPFVGSLAGYIKDANIINVTIKHNDNARVHGLNFVGSVAGMVVGESKLRNITVYDANVIADKNPTNAIAGIEGENEVIKNNNPVSTVTAARAYALRQGVSLNSGIITLYDNDNITNIKNMVGNYSYAGGAFGYVDIYSKEANNNESIITSYQYKPEMETSDYNIIKTRILNSVNVRGLVAGGMAGFTGYNTHIKDAGVELNEPYSSSFTSTSRITAVKFYAGGIVGQAYGALAQVYTQYSEEIQSGIDGVGGIENSLSAYYTNGAAERGGVNIFTSSASDNHSQVYIGGLVGYAGSGSLYVGYSKLNVVSMSANYSGGLIGGLNSGLADLYNISDNLHDDIATNYYIQEAYSTGDIRAKNAAGGIIGQLNQGTRAKLASVNSANFISLNKYDGSNSNFTADDLVENEVDGLKYYSFEKMGVYSILGDFNIASSGSKISLVEKAEAIEFIQLYEKSLVEDADKEEEQQKEAEPSVGAVKRYVISGFAGSGYVKLTEFPGVEYDEDGNICEFVVINGEKKKVDGSDELFKDFTLPIISTFASARQGHESTYGSFLGTHLWSDANWYHYSTDLYPKIRFSVAQKVYMYLDQYNIKEVLDAMSANLINEVIIRGKVAKDVEEYGDVDLRNVLTSTSFWGGGGESAHGVEGYRGKLSTIDLDEANIQTQTGNPPKLILSTPLFSSVKEGFELDNVTIDYKAKTGFDDSYTINSSDLFFVHEDDNGNHPEFRGAFINEGAYKATIKGLTLNVYTAINLVGDETASVGMVASSISGTSLNGITVNFDYDSIYSGDYNERSKAPLSISGGRNVGVIAGEYIQSQSKDVTVENISIRNNRNNAVLLNVDFKGTISNAGGYFGTIYNAEKDQETLQNVGKMTISLGQMTKADNIPAQFKVSGKNVNVGGYIGSVGAGEIKFNFTNSGIRVNAAINVINSENANVGLMFGEINNTNALTVRGVVTDNDKTEDDSVGETENTNTISSVIGSISGNVTTDANLGGIVGRAVNAITIENIKVDLEVGGSLSRDYISPISGDKATYLDKFNSDSYGFTPFEAKTANVGGYVGFTSNVLTIVGTTKIDINSGDKAMSVKGKNVNMGSMVGNIESPLTINGNFVSNAILNAQIEEVETGNMQNIGGLVGRILAKQNGTSTPLSNFTVDIAGDGNSKLGYMGQIFIDCKQADVGGIVGGVYDLSKVSGATFKLTNTVFGGAIKTYGSKTNNVKRNVLNDTFKIGGSVGNFGWEENTNSNTFDIQNNYNFGDVFVLDSYLQMHYGGLIGSVYSNMSSNAVQNNYILTTYHNDHPLAGESANAVFGTGATSGIANTNYYNHSACLLTDDLANDRGYYTDYSKSESVTGGGYANYYKNKSESGEDPSADGLAQIIKAGVLGVYSPTEGSKLSPITLSSNGTTGETITADVNESGKTELFNGMRYYVLTGNLSLSTKHKIADNLAYTGIIGDGYTIDTTTSLNEEQDDPIASLSGQAFVSGLNVLVNKNVEISNERKVNSVGGLVSEMTGGQIYSVGVLGNMSVGGSKSIPIGGLVGAVEKGYIANSFTDVEIIYRAGEKGNASTITNAAGGIIDRTHATGSVTSYIDAYIDGFTNGAADVRNSYSAASLFWKDYTTSATSPESDRVSVFNGATVSNCYYDVKAMGTVKTEKDVKQAKTANLWNIHETKTENDNTEIVSGINLGIDWVNNINYNYGYPTQNIGYLKASSYKKLTTKEKDKVNFANLPNDADGIETNTYERLSNSEVWAAEHEVDGKTSTGYGSYYYTIPNVGVWDLMFQNFAPTAGQNQTNAKADVKVTLRNDIYFDYGRGEAENNTTYDMAGKSLTLDGQGYRIYNLKGRALFGQIGVDTAQSKIQNLDILNTEVGTLASASESGAILALKITKAIVSNITLSGDLISKAENVGALASELDMASVYSVMNNTYIKSTGQKFVGGIIGSAYNVKLQRCVNNGPIYKEMDTTWSASTEKWNNAAGGIVGELTKDSAIYYSYNTASVAAGYTIEHNYKKTTTTGGIAGYASESSLIGDCYNSGLIKSGNKKCTEPNYAGGILGYASGEQSKLSNCVNEGSVEALSVNHRFGLTGQKVLNQNWKPGGHEWYSFHDKATPIRPLSKLTISIKASTDRLVYASGIVGGSNDVNATTNCYNTNSEIINNGAALKKGTEILNKTKNVENFDYVNGSFLDLGDLTGAPYHIVYWSEIGGKYGTSIDGNKFVVTSRNEYNMPTSLYVKTTFNMQMYNMHKGTFYFNDFNPYTRDDYISFDFTDELQKECDAIMTGLADKADDASFEAISTIKGKVLDETASRIGENNSIIIAGTEYYLTNGSGSEALALMNSCYVYTTTYNIDSKFADKKIKDFIVTSEEPSVLSVEVTAKIGTNLTLTIYSSKAKEEWTSKQFNIGYRKAETIGSIDLSNLKYSVYYIGEDKDKKLEKIEIDVQGMAVKDSVGVDQDLAEFLGDRFVVGTNISTDGTKEGVKKAFKLDIGNESLVLVFENGKFVYYPSYYNWDLEKNKVGELVTQDKDKNGEDIDIQFFRGKTAIVYYNRSISVGFLVDGSDISKGSIVNSSKLTGEISQSTTVTNIGSRDEAITVGGKGTVTVNKNGQFGVNSGITSSNIVTFNSSQNTTSTEEFSHYNNVRIQNKVTLIDPTLPAEIRLGDDILASYDSVNGWSQGSKTEITIEDTTFDIEFNSDNSTLNFVYTDNEVEEIEVEAIQTLLEKLVNSGNYLTCINCNVDASVEKNTVNKTKYSITTSFTADVTGATPMSLYYNNEKVASYNGNWNSINSITINGMEGVVNVIGNTITITYTTYDQEEKNAIESMYANWKLKYDSIVYTANISNLNPGDIVGLRNGGTEIATYNSSWNINGNALSYNGITATFSNGAWAFANVDNDDYDGLETFLDGLTYSYKEMQVKFTLPNNIAKAIVYGDSQETKVVGTYDGTNWTTVKLNDNIEVSVNGNEITYTIQNYADVDNAIEAINKSLFYYESILNISPIEVSTTKNGSATQGELKLDWTATLAGVVLDDKNSKFELISSSVSGQYNVGLKSGKWDTKIANGVTVRYGSASIGSYTAIYGIKTVTTTLTNNGSLGYGKLTYTGLTLKADQITEKELTANETLTTLFDVSAGAETLTVNYAIYKSYVETKLEKYKDYSEKEVSIGKYFDSLKNWDEEYGYGTVDKNGVFTAVGSYIYSNDGRLRAVTRSKQFEGYEITYSATLYEDDILKWQISESIADEEENYLVTYNTNTGKWTVRGRDGEFDSLDAAFTKDGAAYTIENVSHQLYDEKNMSPSEVIKVSFSKEDFSIDINQVAAVKDKDRLSVRNYFENLTGLSLNVNTQATYILNNESIEFTLSDYVIDVNDNVLYKGEDTAIGYDGDHLTIKDENGHIIEITNDIICLRGIPDDEGQPISILSKPNGVDSISLYYYGERAIDSIEMSLLIEENNTEKYKGIIFTRNLSLGEVSGIIDFAGQIVGNDYTISYYTENTSLFTTIQQKDKNNKDVFIKDLNIVGQMEAIADEFSIVIGTKPPKPPKLEFINGYQRDYPMALSHVVQVIKKDKVDTSFAILAETNKGKISNVSVFGNIRNVKVAHGQSASGMFNKNESADIDNITSFVSINGVNAEKSADEFPIIAGVITETVSLTGDVKSAGLLVAGNGVAGKNGETGNVGGNGSNGGDIYALSSLVKNGETDGSVNNYDISKAYIVTGKGGAAGKGGDGIRGEFLDISETVAKVSIGYRVAGGNGYAPGNVGAGGKIYLYNKKEPTDVKGKYNEQRNGRAAVGGNGGTPGLIACFETIKLCSGVFSENDAYSAMLNTWSLALGDSYHYGVLANKYKAGRAYSPGQSSDTVNRTEIELVGKKKWRHFTPFNAYPSGEHAGNPSDSLSFIYSEDCSQVDIAPLTNDDVVSIIIDLAKQYFGDEEFKGECIKTEKDYGEDIEWGGVDFVFYNDDRKPLVSFSRLLDTVNKEKLDNFVESFKMGNDIFSVEQWGASIYHFEITLKAW